MSNLRSGSRHAPVILLAVPFLFWAFWFVFPESSMLAVIEETAALNHIPLEISGMRKGLFYNISVDSVSVRGNHGEIIVFNNVASRVNPFQLMLKRIDMSVEADTGKGEIKGTARFAGDVLTAKFDFRGVTLDEIKFLKQKGITGKGTVSGFFSVGNGIGHVEFASPDLMLEDHEFSGTRAPLSLFHSSKGALEVRNNEINITSLSFEGKNIYARIKGSVRNSIMDLVMEIMPEKAFIENPFIFAGLDPYKISPGYYIIPLRGELSM